VSAASTPQQVARAARGVVLEGEHAIRPTIAHHARVIVAFGRALKRRFCTVTPFSDRYRKNSEFD